MKCGFALKGPQVHFCGLYCCQPGEVHFAAHVIGHGRLVNANTFCLSGHNFTMIDHSSVIIRGLQTIWNNPIKSDKYVWATEGQITRKDKMGPEVCSQIQNSVFK